MKIVTILGARPQFIKAAPVSKAIQDYNLKNSDDQITEIIVHTGQHYDDNMSAVFFQELKISNPDFNLDVGSGSHGWQTAQMLIRIEEILIEQKPDLIIVYGDTNSTLAGALAAIKLHISVVHVESGLRSFNREMPEEHNRVLVDHCSDFLFCPTQTAVDNLAKAGITHGVYLVGDTMYDAFLQFFENACQQSTILEDLGIKSKEYLLATVHRPNNTDIPENLQNILSAFLEINEPIIFPVHPRTHQKIQYLPIYKFISSSIHNLRNLKLISPVGYLDMLMLMQNAKAILTDSGGIQKEAYFFGVPCITMRTETEWVETVRAGWNIVVGADQQKIIKAVRSFKMDNPHPKIFGDGEASTKIIRCLTSHEPNRLRANQLNNSGVTLKK
jgi:UDP-N-acetylglucosamine 2-epimerase (non-hydrolysing)